MVSSENSLIQLWDRGMSMVILFFSRFVYEVLIKFGSRLELVISVILFSSLWFIFDYVCRKYVVGIKAVRSNSQWKYVIFTIFDFVSTLLMFLLAQLVLNGLIEVMQVGNLNFAESMTVILVVILFGSAGFIHIRTLIYGYADNQADMENEIKETKRTLKKK